MIRAVEPAIFLDRDNTLIHNDGDLGDPEQVRLKDGVAEGLKTLRVAGYRLVVVTNQGGVARGRYTEADVDTVNQRIAGEVETQTQQRPTIDRFYYCPYHPEGSVEEYRRDHPWRKPHPGMMLQAARDMNIDLASSWLIGDQPRDVQAGRAAGCRTIMIHGDEELVKQCRPTAAVTNFAEAVELVLRQSADEENAPVTPTNGASKTKVGPKVMAKKQSKSPAVAAIATPVLVPERAAPTPMKVESEAPVVETIRERPTSRENISDAGSNEQLRRTMVELTEELRTQRQRKAEFTPIKLAAGVSQILALLMAALGLLQITSNVTAMQSWISFAILMQVFTVTLLMFERH